MGDINRWWKNKSDERFWLEVTRRPDIGANLKTPQTNERGEHYWSYSLLTEINPGDVVYHYDGNKQSVVARSVAVGVPWQDELTWAARGLSARKAGVTPHSRRGWYFGLERFQQLHSPVTLADIRERSTALAELKKSLENEAREPLYFPFELSVNRPVRPMQGYMFKLPSAFLTLFGLEVSSQITIAELV